MAFGAIAIATAAPTTPSQPFVVFTIDLALFWAGLYGVHCITMRILVYAQSFQVSSVFRSRVTQFRDFRSATDRETGQWQTFDVIDLRAKHVLYVTSSFITDSAVLVDLIQHGVRDHRMPSSLTNR